MKTLILFLCLICAGAVAPAQITNYVKNPSFEDKVSCPSQNNQISLTKYWHCAVDTVGEPYYAPEYYHGCASLWNVRVPDNACGYQLPHSGNAYIGGLWYYDQTLPTPFVPPIGEIMHRVICISLSGGQKLLH